jgi:anti-sigma factor RsiW
MDCRTFRDNHLAFLDDALDDAELVAMQRHLAECEVCAQHDTAVRRSLLVFRNLPHIEPSADFRARLDARLDAVRRSMSVGQSTPMPRGPGLGTFFASAAGVIAAGYLLTAAFDWNAAPQDLALAPVVATRPAEPPTPAPIASPAIVTSVSSGMALWPAALMAEQAPVHFAASQFQLANWTR